MINWTKLKAVLASIPEDMYIKELKIDKDILELKNFLREKLLKVHWNQL